MIRTSINDENTIGVVAIMGVTYTGMYEPSNRSAKHWTASRSAPDLMCASMWTALREV